MFKRALTIFVLVVLLACAAFGRSATYEQFESQLLSYKAYTDIRNRALGFDSYISSSIAELEKKVRFYTSRGDNENLELTNRELEAVALDSITPSVVDYCLSVLYSSGYTTAKEEELRVELFEALGIKTVVNLITSVVDPAAGDQRFEYYPYDTFTIPETVGSRTISFWTDDSGHRYRSGEVLTLGYEEINLAPVHRSLAVFHPGSGYEDSVVEYEDGSMIALPQLEGRGLDQAVFKGWEYQGQFLLPGNLVPGNGESMEFYGVWANYHVSLVSFIEKEGGGDGLVQMGETGIVRIKVDGTGNFNEPLKVDVSVPAALAGCLALGATENEYEYLVRILSEAPDGGGLYLNVRLTDKDGNSYHREVQISVNQASLDIGIGAVSYSPSRGKVYIEVVNNSDSSALVLPEFTLTSADGGFEVTTKTTRYETINAGESIFVGFNVTDLGGTGSGLFKLDYRDRFFNSGTLDVTVERRTATSGATVNAEGQIEDVAFNSYRVNQTSSDGKKVIQVDMSLFNNGEATLSGLTVEASIDGKNWEGFVISDFEPGLYATSSDWYDDSSSAKESLFSSVSSPIDLTLTPELISKYAEMADDGTGTMKILLRATSASGGVWQGSFDIPIEDSMMDVSLTSLTVTPLGNGDDVLESGEMFGVSAVFRNNGKTDLSNIQVSLSTDGTAVVIDYSKAIISLLKAGEEASVEFVANGSYRSQLVGHVDEYLREDTDVTLVLELSKSGKDAVALQQTMRVYAWEPDVTIRTVYLSGKESGEAVYGGDRLMIKPVLDNASGEILRNLTCTVTSESPYIEGVGSMTIGTLAVATLVPTGYSVPALTVARNTPAGTTIPLTMLFTDEFGRTFSKNYDLQTGYESFNIVLREIYLLSKGRKLSLTASPGSTVYLGFDYVNTAKNDSIMMYAKLEVVGGTATVPGGMLALGSMEHGKVVSTSASATAASAMSIRIPSSAKAGDRVTIRLTLYSLGTPVKTQDITLDIV